MSRYIDVTDLSKQISDFKKAVNSPNSDYMTGYICALSVTEGIIAETPTADVVEVRHGYWRYNRHQAPTEKSYFCSLCAEGESDYGKDKYCNSCGAKMDGERREE